MSGGYNDLTKYYCPKCDKQLSKPEIEKILCSNCGKLTHIDTKSNLDLKPENTKKRKQKYILVSVIAVGSLIVATMSLYSYSANPQFYEYSVECKKSVDNETMPILDANLTLTQSQIEGNVAKECMTYGNDNYCYQIGMSEAPKLTDTSWSCDVLSVAPVSNYAPGTIVAAGVQP